MSIEHNIPDVVKAVKDAAKQVRFAEAQALNDCALAVQKETVETLLPKNFTLRAKGAPWQRPGTKLGFNIRPFANKDNLEARVGTQADWTKLQEEGGTKDPANHRIAIPTPFWKRREEVMQARKKPRAIVKEEDKASANVSNLSSRIGALNRRRDSIYANEVMTRQRGDKEAAMQIRQRRKMLDREIRKTESARNRAVRKSESIKKESGQIMGSLGNKPFRATMRSGRSGIFVRTSKKRGPLKALFWFEDAAKIKPRMGFVPNGRAVVNRVYQAAFDRRIAVALATAK